MKKLPAVVLFFLLFQTSFGQTAFYVDVQHGSNSNTGLSVADAWQTIQKAADNALPGSTVYIRGGIYHEKINMHVTGLPGLPIVFRNYDTDSVFVDGTGFTPASVLLHVTDKSYLEFISLTFRNLTGNNSQGVLLECSKNGSMSHISFKKIHITNINWNNNPNKIPGDNDNAQGFIAYGYGTTTTSAMNNIVLDSCEVHNNITGFSEAISFDGNIDTIAVTHCLVHDNTNIGILIGGNYRVSNIKSLDHARNAVVKNNACYRNVSKYATSGGIYVDGGWKTLVTQNVCYGNGYGIEIGCEENGTTDSVTVRDNIIYENKESGMQIGGYDKNTTGQVLNSAITSNTFYHNNTAKSGTGEFDLSKLSNCSILNNIFFTDKQSVLFSVDPITPQKNNRVDYNCWYTQKGNANDININWHNTSYSTFNQYKKATSFDSNSVFVNPLFVADSLYNFRLANNSPCINMGTPVYSVMPGETDFEGNDRVKDGRIDMGAFEHQPGTLAVSQTSLRLHALNNRVVAEWTITHVGDIHAFYIERSEDALHFFTISNVIFPHRSTHFSYTDSVPLQGINYYRLRVMSKNLPVYYSEVASIKLNGTNKLLQVSPNPATNLLRVKYTKAILPAMLTIATVDGKGLYKHVVVQGSEETALNISNLAAGMYFLFYSNEREKITSRFVKQ